jgi:hypothetical protein
MAQMSVEDAADTPVSQLLRFPTLGLDTTDHDAPSQCSIRVRLMDESSKKLPTAQADVGDSVAP